MAEYELIEERIVSGRGQLKVPQQARPIRHYILYLDVFRRPRQEYINRNYNPPRSKYAFLTFQRDNYVVHQESMEFPRQLIENVNDITGQNLIAIKCAYQGILQTFVNLAAAMPIIFPTTLENAIKDYESLDLFWDTVNIVCYANTAVQARLYKLEYDRCDPDFDDKKKPPPPPPPRPTIPTTTPVTDNSPAYPGSESDTAPFPGDGVPPSPFPAGNACQRMRVTLRYTQFGSQSVTTSAVFFGPITGVRLRQKPAPSPEHFIEVESRGLSASGSTCQANPLWARFNSAGGTNIYTNLEVVSIVPA